MPVVFGPMPESNGWSVEPGLGGLPACSDWARSQHLDPVGSAGYYEGFLLIEQPLPWPFDVSSIPDLMEVAKLAASAHLRLQAVIPASGQEAGSRTMRVEADDAEKDGVEEAERSVGVEVVERSSGSRRRSGRAGRFEGSSATVRPARVGPARWSARSVLPWPVRWPRRQVSC